MSSVGSVGHSYHNALAESVIGLYTTELIRRRGPWRGLDDLELATLEWVDWWNHRRIHSAWGMTPPAEAEAAYYRKTLPTNRPGPLATASTKPRGGSPTKRAIPKNG